MPNSEFRMPNAECRMPNAESSVVRILDQRTPTALAMNRIPLRSLLAAPGIIPSFGIYDAFSARLVADVGVPMLFLGGFGAAASTLGLPDVGLLTQTEMAEAVRRIVDRVDTPLVADADTGYGGIVNVRRTVREFERAGAAGLLLEDQVFPKRCGHFAGKQVIPAAEMLDKLKAALDARGNGDFVIFARTDARAVEGFDAACERARLYGECGADVCFIEAPQSVDELSRLPREVPFPQMANMLVGGATPILSLSELESLGFKIGVSPIETLAAAGAAVRELARTLLRDGRIDRGGPPRLSFAEIKETLGLEDILRGT